MGLDMYLDVTDMVTNQVIETVTWRKANAIHWWFVKNTGEGTGFDIHDLEVLYNTLVELTPENCSVNLPTFKGPFFGSYEYDDNYWEKVEYTIHTLKDILDRYEGKEVYFVYTSSW